MKKLSTVTYPFYFINGEPVHKINCMQSIEHISTTELFSSIIIVMFYQYAVDTHVIFDV